MLTDKDYNESCFQQISWSLPIDFVLQGFPLCFILPYKGLLFYFVLFLVY